VIITCEGCGKELGTVEFEGKPNLEALKGYLCEPCAAKVAAPLTIEEKVAKLDDDLQALSAKVDAAPKAAK